MKTTSKNNPVSLAKLTGAMLIFGTIGIFRRWIPLSSAWMAFFRGTIGSLFLVFLLIGRRKNRAEHLTLRTVFLLILSGALIGYNWILLFEAYNYTTVSVATLCYYMEPTLVVVLSALIFREKLTPKKILCTLAALLGMVLVSGVLEAGGIGTRDMRGILLGLAASCLYSVVVLMNKSLPPVEPYGKTILQLSSAAVVLIPYLLLAEGTAGLVFTPKTVALLLFVGVVHTGISYSLYFGSMDGLKTQTVALFSYIDPVTALILSALLLHEQMTPLGILGAILILGAAAIAEL